MKDMRKRIDQELSKDQRASMVVNALRGKGLNDADTQEIGIDMKVVTMEEISGSTLPTYYEPKKLEEFFGKRPNAVFSRIWQIGSTSASFLGKVLLDVIFKTPDIEVKRAAELRETIVSLGPFFIKLGQALSIRPDILSPRAMVELQQLCDKVPTFDTNLAMQTIRDELGEFLNL